MKTQHILQLAAGLLIASASAAQSFTPSQQPSDTASVPGNVMLALSVEWPTGLQATYTTLNYAVMTQYVGYFDNRKCYSYSTANEVFTPRSRHERRRKLPE